MPVKPLEPRHAFPFPTRQSGLKPSPAKGKLPRGKSLLKAETVSPLVGQLIRFGIVGGLSTLIYAAVYWPLATYVMYPTLAVPIAFVVAVAFGYVFHSRWSFRDHKPEQRSRTTQAKFVSVQAFGMLLNAAFTWLLTGPLVHGPTWWPLVPAVVVVPPVTFVLNRWWVFA